MTIETGKGLATFVSRSRAGRLLLGNEVVQLIVFAKRKPLRQAPPAAARPAGGA